MLSWFWLASPTLTQLDMGCEPADTNADGYHDYSRHPGGTASLRDSSCAAYTKGDRTRSRKFTQAIELLTMLMEFRRPTSI